MEKESHRTFAEKVCEMGSGSSVDCRGELGNKECIFADGNRFAEEIGRVERLSFF